MANLQSFQTELIIGRLYKITEIKPRPTSNAWITIQGTGTVDIYVAEDGTVTPGDDPVALTEMGKTIESTTMSQQMEGNHNFISIQTNTGTNKVYISGVNAENLAAIS